MEPKPSPVRGDDVTVLPTLTADAGSSDRRVGRPPPRPPRPALALGRTAEARDHHRDLTRSVVVTASSFERFYAEERDRLLAAVAHAIGDVDLAADAIDEAFVRAYERWSHLDHGRAAGWVYRVALNWSRSVFRRRRLARRHVQAPTPHELGMIEPVVHEALAELDVKHRSVVVCRHLLGWSVADTADALGIRPGTVKSRLSRATTQLRARLHHLDPEQETP